MCNLINLLVPCSIWICLLCSTITCKAQEASANELLQELVNLRLDVEMQQKEIRELKEEIRRLSSLLSGKVVNLETVKSEVKKEATEKLAAEDIPQALGGEQPKNTSSSKRTQHVISKGDTLSAIAKKYGVSIQELLQKNPNVQARRLIPGKVIDIP